MARARYGGETSVCFGLFRERQLVDAFFPTCAEAFLGGAPWEATSAREGMKADVLRETETGLRFPPRGESLVLCSGPLKCYRCRRRFTDVGDDSDHSEAT